MVEVRDLEFDSLYVLCRIVYEVGKWTRVARLMSHVARVWVCSIMLGSSDINKFECDCI